MLPQSRRYSQVIHKGFKLVSAVLVASKLVEAGEAGTEENIVARAGGGRGFLHGAGEVVAHRVGDFDLAAGLGQLGFGLADQEQPFDAGSDATDEPGDVATL